MFFFRMRASVDVETWWISLKLAWLLTMLAWSWLSVIALLAKTMFTISLSCCSVNIGGLAPCRSWPSILCRKKKTVYNSTVISQEKVTEVLIVHRIQYCKQLLKPCRCFLIWWYFYNTYFPVEMFLSHLPLCIGLDLAVLAVQPPSAPGRGWQRGQPVLRGSHLSDSVLLSTFLSSSSSSSSSSSTSTSSMASISSSSSVDSSSSPSSSSLSSSSFSSFSSSSYSFSDSFHCAWRPMNSPAAFYNAYTPDWCVYN